MRIFGIVGWSGCGKTALVEALLPILTSRGLSVSTIKHTHERVDLDQPGKDSFRHRTAGATDVVLLSPSRWTLIHEVRDDPVPKPEDVIAMMTPVDLVLVEGFKALEHKKIEVYRRVLGKPLLVTHDRHIEAVATDEPIPGVSFPILDLNNPSAIASFIIETCGLASRPLI